MPDPAGRYESELGLIQLGTSGISPVMDRINQVFRESKWDKSRVSAGMGRISQTFCGRWEEF